LLKQEQINSYDIAVNIRSRHSVAFAPQSLPLKEVQPNARSSGHSAQKLLADNAVQLNDGGYIGIIVRNSFYKVMDDKESVSQILTNRDAYITSKQILVASDNISVL